MAKIRQSSVRAKHSLLAGIAVTWDAQSAAAASRRYGYRQGIAHLWAARRGLEAVMLLVEFAAQMPSHMTPIGR